MKQALAKELGADLCINPTKEDSVKVSNSFSGGHGVDCVLFTAATSSSKPLSDSFKMCRKKGKVVLVGVVGMEINRGDMYAKELDFQISTSYGPGRYDSNYEEKGLDYPLAYVRWTENKNMTEYVQLLEEGKINIAPLIDAVYPIEKVDKAFSSLDAEGQKPIIVLLDYKNYEDNKKVKVNFKPVNKAVINVGIVGAGNFVTGMHLPNMKKLGNKYSLRAVMNRTGFSADAVAKQFGAAYSTTDFDEIINDKDIDLVMITTRHDSHADYVLRSLKAGKHTFVEKPLAVNQDELDKIKEFYNSDAVNKPVLMTGFNRGFSQFTTEIKKHTDKRINPLFVQYRMNAGFVPLDSWVHEYGGRIVGEACHLMDLMSSLTNYKISSISYEKRSLNNEILSQQDNVVIALKYGDGSVCNIHYFTSGSKKISKEYMEVHYDDKTIVTDNYKTLKGNTKNWTILLEDMIQTTESTFLTNN